MTAGYSWRVVFQPKLTITTRLTLSQRNPSLRHGGMARPRRGCVKHWVRIMFLAVFGNALLARAADGSCAFDPSALEKHGKYYIVKNAELTRPDGSEKTAEELIVGRMPSFTCVARKYRQEDGVIHTYTDVKCENAATGAEWEPYVDIPRELRMFKGCGTCAVYAIQSPFFAILDNSDNFQVFDSLNRRTGRSDPFPLRSKSRIEISLSSRDSLGGLFHEDYETANWFDYGRYARFDQFRGLHAPLTFGLMPKGQQLDVRNDSDVAACAQGTVTKYSIDKLTTYQILDQITRALGYEVPIEHKEVYGSSGYDRDLLALAPLARKVRLAAIKRNELFSMISVETEGPYKSRQTDVSVTDKVPPASPSRPPTIPSPRKPRF
jgi:hypothetical protein